MAVLYYPQPYSYSIFPNRALLYPVYPAVLYFPSLAVAIVVKTSLHMAFRVTFSFDDTGQKVEVHACYR